MLRSRISGKGSFDTRIAPRVFLEYVTAVVMTLRPVIPALFLQGKSKLRQRHHHHTVQHFLTGNAKKHSVHTFARRDELLQSNRVLNAVPVPLELCRQSGRPVILEHLAKRMDDSRDHRDDDSCGCLRTLRTFAFFSRQPKSVQLAFFKLRDVNI